MENTNKKVYLLVEVAFNEEQLSEKELIQTIEEELNHRADVDATTPKVRVFKLTDTRFHSSVGQSRYMSPVMIDAPGVEYVTVGSTVVFGSSQVQN